MMIYEKLKDYFVDDLIYEDTKVLFVLESPHNEEVKQGYPVAGKSGKDMTRVVFGGGDALGKLIFEKKVQKLGILNVSNYPLQMSAYDDAKMEDAMVFFEKIRQNPRLRKNKMLSINKVINTMMNSFKTRLTSHTDKTIILCGKFAEASFDNVVNEANFKEVLRVPHPSFNQWLRESNKDKIDMMLKAIQ